MTKTKCTNNILMKAIASIKDTAGGVVTAIQFEDGSGYKFNYQLDGGQWQFINLGQAWYDQKMKNIDNLRKAVTDKDDVNFGPCLSKVLMDYHQGLGGCYFNTALFLAKQQGKDGVINEIFNNEHN